jgi:hypothetical protein
VNPTVPQQTSARQGAKDAFSRLTALEKRLADQEQTSTRVLMAVNQAFGSLGKAVDDQAETVEAIVSLTGPDQVAQVIAELRATKLRQQAETTKAQISLALTEGKLLKAEVIGENSLVVGREVNKDGAELPPGYAAARVSALPPDNKERVMGHKVGDVVETKEGGKFTVQEVYDYAPPKPAETPAAPPPAAEPQVAASPAPVEPTPEQVPQPEPTPVAETSVAAPAQA